MEGYVSGNKMGKPSRDRIKSSDEIGETHATRGMHAQVALHYRWNWYIITYLAEYASKTVTRRLTHLTHRVEMVRRQSMVRPLGK